MSKKATNSRQAQREATRLRIVEAAITAFTDKGFHGASTRDIAALAGTNQGLVTYHFSNKETLWRAAADHLFAHLDARLGPRIEALRENKTATYAREAIREYVRFVAETPALFRLMVDEGRVADERMQWLVDAHIKPRYDMITTELSDLSGLNKQMIPHAFYALAGASSLIFAVAPECQRLTGIDPQSTDAIEAHADFVSGLILPAAD